jgi:lysophospholipase L1-like esterase
MTWQQNLPAGSQTNPTCEIVAFEDGNGTLNKIQHRWTGKSNIASYSTDSNGNVTGLVGPSGTLPLSTIAKTIGGISFLNSVIGGGTTPTANNTFIYAFDPPQDWDAVRMILLNNDISLPCLNVQAGAAVTDGPQNNAEYWSPMLAGSRNDAAVTPLTFNGSATGTIPQAISNQRPGILVSDWLPLSTLQSAIATSRNMFLGYFYYPASGGSAIGFVNGTQDTFRSAYESNFVGRKVRAYAQTGNLVTTPSAAIPATSGAYWVPMMWQFRYRNPVKTVFICGDSVEDGNYNAGSAGEYLSWARRAVMAQNASFAPGGVSVEAQGMAAGSTTSTNYVGRFLDMAQYLIGSAIIYKPYSSNDASSPTAATNVTEKALTLQMIGAAQQMGIPIVITTPFPTVAPAGAAYSGATLAAYNDMRSWVLARADGVSVFPVDCNSINDLTGYGVGVWPSVYYGNSNVHPNDAGQAAIGALATPILRTALAGGPKATAPQILTPGQFPGITTGGAAQVGNVGELLTNTASPNAVSLATGAGSGIASLTLTPGDWDVWGTVNFTPAGTTSITQLSVGPSTTNGVLPAQDQFAQLSIAANVPGANIIDLACQPIPFNVSVSTNVFLIAKATFTVSTLGAGGTIWARRRR